MWFAKKMYFYWLTNSYKLTYNTQKMAVQIRKISHCAAENMLTGVINLTEKYTFRIVKK